MSDEIQTGAMDVGRARASSTVSSSPTGSKTTASPPEEEATSTQSTGGAMKHPANRGRGATATNPRRGPRRFRNGVREGRKSKVAYDSLACSFDRQHVPATGETQNAVGHIRVNTRPAIVEEDPLVIVGNVDGARMEARLGQVILDVDEILLWIWPCRPSRRTARTVSGHGEEMDSREAIRCAP